MKLKNKVIGIIGIIAILSIILIGGYKNNYQPTKNTQQTSNAQQTSNLYDCEDYLILVNKQNSIDGDYIPQHLVKVNIKFLDDTQEESRCMEKEAAEAVEDLFACAKKEGITLIGSSAYRSYQSQVRVLKEQTYKKGYDYAMTHVAQPGQSEHQSGLAIDITNEVRCFDKTSKEAQWLAKNAHKFGFILRYPEGKEKVTGYDFEPWHIRYVGKDVAKEIYKNGITLEEYLKNKA